MHAPFVVEVVAIAALGALQTLAYVESDSWWWLQGLAVAVLARRAAETTPLRAALLGLAFGTAWIGAGTWWLFISMHRYGGLPAWLAALAVALLAALLSLYLAAAMAAFVRWRTGRPARDAALFASVWLLAELARGVLFTGFPWVASGYAHVDSPLATLAPWIGVYGIGALAAGVAAWLGLQRWGAWRSALARSTGAAVALVAVATLLPAKEFSAPATMLSVTLLQANVPQEEKFERAHVGEALEWTRDRLLAAKSDLVVGPETVIPLLPQELDPAYWRSLVEHFQGAGRAALVGLPLGDSERGYTNSAVGLSAAQLAAGAPYRYDKHHLVPFGEFIPTGFRWFTELMRIPLGDFDRGPLDAPSFPVKGERIAPNICYEDLFGEELAARFRDPARAPTVFANLSNIGWFGDTVAIPQHLNISRMRSLEFERPMLRATNTGATVVIDHRGRVTAALEPYTQGTLDASVEGRVGRTPYAIWAGRFGLWPLLVIVLAIIAAQAAIPVRKPARARARAA